MTTQPFTLTFGQKLLAPRKSTEPSENQILKSVIIIIIVTTYDCTIAKETERNKCEYDSARRTTTPPRRTKAPWSPNEIRWNANSEHTARQHTRPWQRWRQTRWQWRQDVQLMAQLIGSAGVILNMGRHSLRATLVHEPAVTQGFRHCQPLPATQPIPIERTASHMRQNRDPALSLVASSNTSNRISTHLLHFTIRAQSHHNPLTCCCPCWQHNCPSLWGLLIASLSFQTIDLNS